MAGLPGPDDEWLTFQSEAWNAGYEAGRLTGRAVLLEEIAALGTKDWNEELPF